MITCIVFKLGVTKHSLLKIFLEILVKADTLARWESIGTLFGRKRQEHGAIRDYSYHFIYQ